MVGPPSLTTNFHRKCQNSVLLSSVFQEWDLQVSCALAQEGMWDMCSPEDLSAALKCNHFLLMSHCEHGQNPFGIWFESLVLELTPKTRKWTWKTLREKVGRQKGVSHNRVGEN